LARLYAIKRQLLSISPCRGSSYQSHLGEDDDHFETCRAPLLLRVAAACPVAYYY